MSSPFHRLRRAPQRAITCPMRGAGGAKCLRTAEASAEPVIHQGYQKQGGGEVRIHRRSYRCTRQPPHLFQCEWIEEIPAAGPDPAEVLITTEES